MTDNIQDIEECPECGSADIIKNEEKEQVTCKSCGLIYEEFAE